MSTINITYICQLKNALTVLLFLRCILRNKSWS